MAQKSSLGLFEKPKNLSSQHLGGLKFLSPHLAGWTDSPIPILTSGHVRRFTNYDPIQF